MALRSSTHILSSPVETATDLGRLLRLRRKELGLLQADVAMQSGISPATLSAIENGKETAQIGIVFKLAADLGIKIRCDL